MHRALSDVQKNADGDSEWSNPSPSPKKIKYNLKYEIGSLNIDGLFHQSISSSAMITLVSKNILQQILHSLMNYCQQYERIFSAF